MTKPEYRLVKQVALCRVCDKELQREVDYMVSWRSIRNGGQNIHICQECVVTLYNLLPKGDTE